MDEKLSDDEISVLVKLLSKLEPGFLPFPVFQAVTRLTVTPIIEVVPLRRGLKGLEILLLRREGDDPIWPNQLHVPGTVIRATDTLEIAMERLLKSELNGLATSKPKYVKSILHNSGRGVELSQIYWVEILDNNKVGQFYDINYLPEEIVVSQMDFIPLAVEDYVN